MTNATGPADVLGVDNVLFAVGDLERALEFYAVTLGLPLKFQLPSLGIACFRLGGKEPGLLIRQGPAAAQAVANSARLWLEVRDARAAAAELRSRGAEPLAEPFEVATGWTVEFADPWGNVVGFTDYLKDRPKARPPKANPGELG